MTKTQLLKAQAFRSALASARNALNSIEPYPNDLPKTNRSQAYDDAWAQIQKLENTLWEFEVMPLPGEDYKPDEDEDGTLWYQLWKEEPTEA